MGDDLVDCGIRPGEWRSWRSHLDLSRCMVRFPLGRHLDGRNGVHGTDVRYDSQTPEAQSLKGRTDKECRRTIPLGLGICASTGATASFIFYRMAWCSRLSGWNDDWGLRGRYFDTRPHHPELSRHLSTTKMAWDIDGNGDLCLCCPFQHLSGKAPPLG